MNINPYPLEDNMKPGTLIILNDVDCPQADLIAVVLDEGRAQYISLRLQHWGPVEVSDLATPIEAFGVGVDLEVARLVTHFRHEGYATYPDGRRRTWQQNIPFTCDLSMKGINAIRDLQDKGHHIQ